MSDAAMTTGTELLDALRRAATARGVTTLDLARKLSPFPSAWIRQLGAAARPKPLTVARVQALIAGEPVPTELPENVAAAASPLSHYERVVLQALSDAADAAKPCPSNTALAETLGRSIAWSAGDIVKRLEKRGLIEVRRYTNSREVTIVATGRSTARSAEAVAAATPVSAILPEPPAPTKRPRAPVAGDRRPMAPSREPCPYCNVRGDLGCRHQAPFEPVRVGGRG